MSNLVRQWDNQMVDSRFVDKRNPQDFVRGVKDVQTLPFARPETPNEFVAVPLLWEDGTYMMSQEGEILLTEGLNPSETL